MTIEEAKKRMNFEMETGVYTFYEESFFRFKIGSYLETRLLINFLHKLGYRMASQDSKYKVTYNTIVVNVTVKEYDFENTRNSSITVDPFPVYLYDVDEIQGFL